MKIQSLILSILLPVAAAAATKEASVTSPDGQLKATINADKTLSYSISKGNVQILAPSEISLTLSDGTVYGKKDKIKKISSTSVNGTFQTPVYKKAEISESYNEITISFKEFELIFRAYDEGVAYRFRSKGKKDFNVKSETARFNFPGDWTYVTSYVSKPAGKTFDKQFHNSFENNYTTGKLSGWEKGHLSFLPCLVKEPSGKRVCIMESDLVNYPGMYLLGEGGTELGGVFAPVPDKVHQGGHNKLEGLVDSYKDYISSQKAGAAMPWRIIMVTDNDAQLADCDLVYKLATPAQGDFSWVKPGKVAWDWWNDWNIKGVDFKAGINNDTYKYYIDFASANGIEYVILDEGWSVNLAADLFQVIPEIDLQGIVDYAASKNVGIILWAGYWAFNRDIEGVCRHFADMGVKGFKVDFMNRDDADMVKFFTDVAATAARYKLVVDFHGAFKPIGLQRTYPNVLNHEGVSGLEQMKWAPKDRDQITYDVTIPFIRMAAGPMDYTQGAMRNGGKRNYFPSWSEPMSQGTRCHQLAMYTILESPLNMLCDSPSSYLAEPECTAFIAAVPTVWDETRVLGGEIGNWVAIARRKGDTWYVGALNGWNEKTVNLDLGFINGPCSVEVFCDGINAEKNGSDYKKKEFRTDNPGTLEARLAAGGGWTARITPEGR